MPAPVNITPSAQSVIESLRSMGYTLETAIADIVDNSISAKAKNIAITCYWDNDGDSWISISDDGEGMSQAELAEAMKLGSHLSANDSDNSLGKFGFGMKTASISQCRSVTLISKKEGKACACVWDLDETKRLNLWEAKILNEVQISEDSNIQDIIQESQYDCEEEGSIVIWRKIDAGYVKEKKAFNNAIARTREHLALTFHRFLIRENNNPAIKLCINGAKVAPFHPFGPDDNVNRIALPEDSLNCGNTEVIFNPYVLPRSDNYPNIQEYDYHAGKEGYIQNQGFYVYRNRRLIQHGTWFRLQRKSEKTQLLRVQIDFPSELDSEWKVNIMKSQIIPPDSVRDDISRMLKEWSEYAENQLLGLMRPRTITTRAVSTASVLASVLDEDSGQMTYKLDTLAPLYKRLMGYPHLPDDFKANLTEYLKKLSRELDSLLVFTRPLPQPNDEESFDNIKELISNLRAHGRTEKEIFYMIQYGYPEIDESTISKLINNEK